MPLIICCWRRGCGGGLFDVASADADADAVITVGPLQTPAAVWVVGIWGGGLGCEVIFDFTLAALLISPWMDTEED